MGSCQSKGVQENQANISANTIYFKKEENMKQFSVGISFNPQKMLQTQCEYSKCNKLFNIKFIVKKCSISKEIFSSRKCKAEG